MELGTVTRALLALVLLHLPPVAKNNTLTETGTVILKNAARSHILTVHPAIFAVRVRAPILTK